MWGGGGGVCRVEECAEWLRCSFPSAEGGVEPAASDSEVVCYLLWCHLRPRFRRQGCCSGGRELLVWEVEVTVVEVEGEKDVAGRHVQAAPAVAHGRAVGGQGCAARGHGYGPRVVRCVRHVVFAQVVPEGFGEWPEEASVAGGGGGVAGAAGRARPWGLRSPQWGQWVRRCAAPRQTQWSALQRRPVCGSRWHTQRGHAVAGGWRYLWTDGGVGAWALVARACWRVCVRCLWCSCMQCRCCACWMVCRHGGGPMLGGMSRGRLSRLVEQEFEEVGLVRRGQAGCMLQVFVGAVGELFRCLGNGRPLHVRCGVLGVFRVGAWQGVDGSGNQPPANHLEYLCLLEDRGELLGCRGPCRPSGVPCDGVDWVPVREGVQSSVQGARLEMVPGFFFRVATDAFSVPCGDVD